jgi:DNA-binding response OmpR family regulator
LSATSTSARDEHAAALDAAAERGREAGADAQLDKPFSPAVLAERVRALLASRDL